VPARSGVTRPKHAEIPEAIANVWSADAFLEDASLIVEGIYRHLDEATNGRGGVTRSFPPPNELLARFPGRFSERPSADLAELLDELLSASPWQHHPRYLGHQVSASIPRAILSSAVASTLNNGMAAFEAGPAATVLERRIIEWMLSLLGWNPSGGGFLTSGGSLGNLTALLAARQAKAGFDVRARGLAGGPALGILASEQVHYSIERAAQVMGLGRDAVISVRTDDRYRLDPDDIRPAIARAKERGITPFALVASAGATGTGSVDPLEAAADACRDLGLWLHVDGAHGASALLSETHRAALTGIERADSIVWDAHKLMSMPALATAVLMRDKQAGYEAFTQSAAYLFHEPEGEPWFDVGLRTIECTKPLIAVPLYICLATLGTDVFSAAVDRSYHLARRFDDMLRASSDFEVACSPDSNIVCFRHVPASSDGSSVAPSASELDAHQRRVRDQLRESGSFYCVLTTLKKKVWLRVSLMNPLTTTTDLEALLDRIRLEGA
jgi:L-2,4-diaminobutyrate decarboxylase